MKKKEWQISLTLICFILGLILSIQFRTQKSVQGTISFARTEEISSMLSQSEKKKKDLESEISILRSKISEYEKATSEDKAILRSMQGELERIRMAMGLTKVSGPGVILILDDSKIRISPGEDPNIYLIHDEDLLKVVNELFASGAEALAVNGQRFVTSSEIRCVGPVMMINGTRVAAPYEILAIGEPSSLENGLLMRGGIVEVLKAVGIRVSITKHNRIEIPPYSGSINLKYVKMEK